MTHTKTILLSLFFTFILIAPLAAKPKKSKSSEQATNENPDVTNENPVVTEAKSVFSKYAGLPELQERGFDLSMLDSANTMEDVYNILLPYMIVDGVPLDNSLEFYDWRNHKDYNFKQHYTVHFTDDYGTKEELCNKGYKDDEILAYYSRGKDVYRGGHFVWEKHNDYTALNRKMPKLTPVSGKNYIYFWAPNFNLFGLYTKYWKEAAKKDYIILDLRLMCLEGSDTIWPFFQNLISVKYKGLVILLIDSCYEGGECILRGNSSSFRSVMNDEEKTSEFKVKCLTIGENTYGVDKFRGRDGGDEVQNNERGWQVHKVINKDKKVDEGICFMPDIWAEN